MPGRARESRSSSKIWRMSREMSVTSLSSQPPLARSDKESSIKDLGQLHQPLDGDALMFCLLAQRRGSNCSHQCSRKIFGLTARCRRVFKPSRIILTSPRPETWTQSRFGIAKRTVISRSQLAAFWKTMDTKYFHNLVLRDSLSISPSGILIDLESFWPLSNAMELLIKIGRASCR